MLERLFKPKEKGTAVRTAECLAGLTTFMTTVYVLAAIPQLMSTAGTSRSALFTATALSSALAWLSTPTCRTPWPRSRS